MQPTESSKTSSKAALGRARLQLVRGLGWTRGFPALETGKELTWLVPDRAAVGGLRTEAIGAAAISRAQRTANTLRRDFPRILPKLVGDPALWRSRVDALLELVKAAVHEGKALPPSLFEDRALHARDSCVQARRIIRSWPALAGVVGSLSWAHAVDQANVGEALRWVEDNGDALAATKELLDHGEARRTSIVLTRLAHRLGPQRVAPVLAWLSDPRVHGTALAGAHEYVGALIAAVHRKVAKRRPYPSERPNAGVASVLRFVDWLHIQDDQSARRALRLFELSAPDSLLSQWHSWWRALDRACATVAKRLLIGVSVPDDDLSRAAFEFVRLRGTAPPALSLRDYFAYLEQASLPVAQQRYRAMVAALEALPDEQRDAAPARFLMHWSALCTAYGGAYSARLPALLDGFRAYLARRTRSAAAWLQPWTAVSPRRDSGFAIDHELLDELESGAAIRRFFDALGQAHEHFLTGIDGDAAVTLVSLVRYTKDAGVAAQLLVHMHEAGLLQDYPYGVLEPAVLITADDVGRFGRVVKALQRLRDEHDLDLRGTFSPLVRAFRDAGCLDLLRRMLLAGEGHRIRLASQRWALLHAARASRGCAPSLPASATLLPDWAREFPTELHEPILRIVDVHPEAERAVVGILGQELPRHAELKQELSVLRRRAAEGSAARGIATRIENLEKRLGQPRALSAAKRDKLRFKLERAVDRAIFAAWERRLEERVGRSICGFLGESEPPAWTSQEHHLGLLSAIATLDGQSRELALRLLRMRGGPPPWDLRTAPANQRFLVTLRERGVRVSAWVDGIGARHHGEDDGLTLQLEDDPLEVMHMGGYFDTCLSPHSFNFFSAVSNAADINKRVLYGRDRQGRVQGRCLLALTDEGGIVTFHVYSHDPRRGFDGMVREFVAELAAEMGAVAVPGGQISNLVASEWYDDGPVDLTTRFAFLQHGSRFRTALASVKPENLRSLLGDAFAPLELNELTLPLVLQLPEISSRSELMVELLPTIRGVPRLSETVLAAVARELFNRGHTALALELFGSRAADYLIRSYRRAYMLDTEIASLLLGWSPSELLSVLRRTRPREQRGWREETDSSRLYFAAEAHRALNRARRAIELYELALAGDASAPTKATIRDRIAELRPAKLRQIGREVESRAGRSEH